LYEKGLERLNATYWAFRRQAILPSDFRSMSALLDSEFVKCGRTMVVDTKPELYAFVKRMMKRRRYLKIYFGSDEFLPTDQHWKFFTLDWDKAGIFRRRIQSYVQSSLFLRELSGFNTKPSLIVDKRKPVVDLRSNTASVFLIYVISIIVYLVVSFLEFQYQILSKYKIINQKKS
jgi:hypothetical protein